MVEIFIGGFIGSILANLSIHFLGIKNTFIIYSLTVILLLVILMSGTL